MFLFSVLSLEKTSAQHSVSSKKYPLPRIFHKDSSEQDHTEQPLLDTQNDVRKISLPSLPSTFDHKKSKPLMQSQPNKTEVRLHVLPRTRLAKKNAKTN